MTSDEHVSALYERIRADERRLEEIEGNTRYRMLAKDLRQRLRLNRGVLQALREERGEA